MSHILSAHLDPQNAGVLIVKLSGGGLSANEIRERRKVA
jgi:hypothetical protein